MTKPTPSGRTLLSVFYRCPRLVQTLSIMSSLSFLGSGFVLAQAESPVDSGTVPSAPASFVDAAPEPAPAPKPVTRSKPSAPASVVDSDIPVRRSAPEPEAPVRLAPRQARKDAPSRAAVVRRERTPDASSPAPVVRRERKPKVSRSESEASVPTIRRKPTQEKPTLPPPNLSVPDASTVARPPKLILSPAQNQESAKIPSEPGNSYIDRADYSAGATTRYESPSAVVLTERSSGCSTVSQNGQISGGVCGIGTQRQNATNQPNSARPTERNLNHLIASQRTVTKQTISYLIAEQPAIGPERSRLEPQRDTTVRLPAPPGDGAVRLSAPPGDGAVRLSVPPGDGAVRLSVPPGDGAVRLSVPPVADAKPTELRPVPVKVASNFMRATRRTVPSGGGWAESKSVSSYSGAASYFSNGRSYFSGTQQTTPSGLSYYNLTARPAAVPNLGRSSFMFPLTIPAAITSVFGWRMHPITGEYRFHAGTDLAAPQGTPVVAAATGQVVTADFVGGYGLTVILQHEKGTQESLYAHLSEIFVRSGDEVEQGTVIGRVGSTGNSTGPHLHFEWRHQTPNGWVAVDAGAHLEYSLAQFIDALKIAQASSPRGF
jgi:murein DD-endopeptidase MepM/ murein hydrolase activator NlpD